MTCQVGPLLPIGLFGVAWTSFGPPTTPWIAPMIFIGLFGIANVRGACVYQPSLTPRSSTPFICPQLTTWSLVTAHSLALLLQATRLLVMDLQVQRPCLPCRVRPDYQVNSIANSLALSSV